MAYDVFKKLVKLVVVMDKLNGQTIVSGIYQRPFDGFAALCSFDKAQAGSNPIRSLSGDNNLSFQLHRWLGDLRVLGIPKIKNLLYVAVSHPPIEYVNDRIRRE